MNDENKRKGYTSISLGEENLAKVDKQSDELGGVPRSMLIRMIITKYYELKDKKCDILKKETNEIKKSLKEMK